MNFLSASPVTSSKIHKLTWSKMILDRLYHTQRVLNSNLWRQLFQKQKPMNFEDYFRMQLRPLDTKLSYMWIL